MDDMQELYNEQLKDQKRLEIALDKAEHGNVLDFEEIDLIRFYCGLPAKRRANAAFTEIFNDWNNIFGGKQ